jgi:cell filamentation protein
MRSKNRGMDGRRYMTPVGPEAESQPGSRGRVLRNLEGITRKRQMDKAEFDTLAQVQEAYLDQVGPETRFTAALICQMHKDWLGQLFVWAGKYRTVELAKSGFSWPPAMMVERNMQAFERDVLTIKTPCRPGPLDRVCLDMAEVHAELLLIHPFREGNGRLARWIAELMALQAGLPLPLYRFTGMGAAAENERYLSAVKAGYLSDYRPLAAFFADAIGRGRP